MEHSIKLASIPADIQFPSHLKSKIRFESAEKQLVFRGFMSKSDYDHLLRLSKDVKYQNAIAQLFQLSTVSDAPQLRQLGRVLAALTIACLFLAAIVWGSLIHSLLTGDNSQTSSGMSANGSIETEHAGHNSHSEH